MTGTFQLKMKVYDDYRFHYLKLANPYKEKIKQKSKDSI